MTSACARLMKPWLTGSQLSLGSASGSLGTGQAPGQSIDWSRFVGPSRSADSARNGLNVEPGGYSAWIARSSDAQPVGHGLPGWDGVNSRAMASLFPVAKMFGSNVGLEAIATTEPSSGFMTTTAPALAGRPNDCAAFMPFSSDSTASCWTPSSMLRYTSSPGPGGEESSGSGPRFRPLESTRYLVMPVVPWRYCS